MISQQYADIRVYCSNILLNHADIHLFECNIITIASQDITILTAKTSYTNDPHAQPHTKKKRWLEVKQAGMKIGG